MPCVDSTSPSCGDRSTRTTSWPARASNIAVAAPAHRDPTTTTSCRVERVAVMTADYAAAQAAELGDFVEVRWRALLRRRHKNRQLAAKTRRAVSAMLLAMT